MPLAKRASETSSITHTTTECKFNDDPTRSLPGNRGPTQPCPAHGGIRVFAVFRASVDG